MLCAVFWGAECLLRGRGGMSDSEFSDDLRFRGLRVYCGSGEGEDGGLIEPDCLGMVMDRTLDSSSRLSCP
jgi:hypothetical protein